MPKMTLKAALAAHATTLAKPARKLTFAELVKAYCAVNFDYATYQMRKWIDVFGDRDAWTIEPAEIDAALKAMKESAQWSNATINRDVGHVGTIYKWAKRKHLAPPGFISPTLNIGRLPEELRVVTFEPAFITKLLDGSLAFKDQRFAVLIHLLHDSGARPSEVMTRQYRHFDFAKRTIALYEAGDTKTGKRRTLFYTKKTAELIERFFPKKRPPDALAFQGDVMGSPKTFRREWRSLRESLGRPDMRLNDLRHHRSAEILRAGQSLAVASQAMGNSSSILQRRYGHLATKHLEETVAASWA